MRTGSIVYRPGAQLPPPKPLPTAQDEVKAAWSNAWWSGIAVGIAIGAGIAVVALKAVH